jgi:DNA polymerase elongation subunit (family B)
MYDIPYLINRITRIISKEATKKFCLWDVLPKEREYKSKFGSMIKTYDLVGRVHLDYMQLYQKHNTKQQLSYRLDYIGEDEVGANKVPYEGNLDDLYKKDFYKFIDYSRQDVNILVLIDKKLKYIELANQVAHQNYVTLKTTMGSVVLVEQAIINYMHKTNLVVPDKKLKPKFDDLDGLFEIEDEKKPVVGAYVADPKTGLHHHIGCVDINSLYPSAIRALNMSPETIVGQVRPTETMALIDQRIAAGTKSAEAWEGIFMLLELEHMHAKDEEEIVIDFEDGTVRTMTGAQLYAYIFDQENHVCITANGTIFRTDRQGIIPALLAEWYAERREYQNRAKEFAEIAKGLQIDDELALLLSE